MELKFIDTAGKMLDYMLLIEPYGIEIHGECKQYLYD